VGSQPGGWGPTIGTPYGDARVNTAGRVLWAEWEVWRHSEDLVTSGLWTSKRTMHGSHERIEYYAVEQDGADTAPGRATGEAER